MKAMNRNAQLMQHQQRSGLVTTAADIQGLGDNGLPSGTELAVDWIGNGMGTHLGNLAFFSSFRLRRLGETPRPPADFRPWDKDLASTPGIPGTPCYSQDVLVSPSPLYALALASAGRWQCSAGPLAQVTQRPVAPSNRLCRRPAAPWHHSDGRRARRRLHEPQQRQRTTCRCDTVGSCGNIFGPGRTGRPGTPVRPQRRKTAAGTQG